MANEEKQEPQGHETAVDLKMRIEKKQAELAQAKIVKKAPLQEAPSKETVESTLVKTEEPQPVKTAEPKDEKTASKPTVDLKEWAKAKGIDWTSDTSVLEALRKSDIEFHRKREERLKAAAQNAPIVTPVTTPQQPAYYPPSNYQAPPVNTNQEMLNGIARQYNMAPEDVERLLKFNHDQFEIMQRAYDTQIQRKFDEIQRENTKNTVFVELSSDPAFRNPEVLHEWHRTVEEMQDRDPQSFEDPSVYRRAYDETLKNIGRRYLQGTNTGSSKSDIFSPPTNPPKPLGAGGEGRMENESELTAEKFSKLSADDQRAILNRMGLVESKY